MCYFQYWVAGSNKTQDILKFPVLREQQPQISYCLCYKQAATETAHQAGSSGSKPAKKGIQRAKFMICLMIFLSPQPPMSELTQWKNSASLCFFVYYVGGDTGSGQAATLPP